jgi:hypothetical protein
MAEPFRTLDFTDTFLETFGSRDFTPGDRRSIRKMLQLLDTNEQHPSLRVHALRGELKGLWSASASDSLRVTFIRLSNGRKRLLTCSKHYDR